MDSEDYDFGVNASVSYEFAVVPKDKTTNQPLFVINSLGKITTNGNLLDRETQDKYTAVIRATDGGSPNRQSE